MLPGVDALFTLVRQLARRQPVTEVAAPKWLVQRHGLGPMAARAGAPGFRDDLARAALDWVRTEQEARPIVAALVEAGVRVAPIKGLAYAKTLYDNPAERPMRDIDLLVPRDRRDSARVVLAQRGFRRAESAVLHHAEAWVRGELALDLHWNIIAPGRSRIDLDAVWSRTSAGWPEHAERLERVDAAVFHLVHLARNRLRLPLINVVDTARLLEHANAREVLARGREWGLGSAVGIALKFCTAICEARPGRPAGWLGPSLEEVALLSEDSVSSKLLFDIATAGSPTQLASRVVHFAANQLRRLNSR
jgi:hypothetical protein